MPCEDVRNACYHPFILSGLNSRHSRSNVVFAQKPGSSDISLAEIRYFAECTFQHNSTDCGKVWIVALKWYMEHPCRVWYGHPAQVWSCTQRTEMDFIPFKCVKERCVYTKSVCKFRAIFRNTGCHYCHSDCLQDLMTFSPLIDSLNIQHTGSPPLLPVCMFTKSLSPPPLLSLSHSHTHHLCMSSYVSIYL